MTTPSPLAAPLAWNLVSDGYVAEIVPHFERYAAEALRLAGVTNESRVVDVAAGPGTLSLVAARLAASVDAIDFAESMIAFLETRARERGITNVRASVGDGQALPFPDAGFDAAFSMFGLMFFPDRAKGFAELLRVLRPGGRAVVSSWHSAQTVPAMQTLFGALQEAMPMPAPAGPPPLSTREDVATEMRDAGFADVEVHSISFALEAPSTDRLVDSFDRSFAPLVLLRSKLGDEGYRPILATIRRRMIETFGEGPQSVAMPAWLGVGEKSLRGR